MKIKKAMSVALVVLMVMSMVLGCGKSSDSNEATEKEGYTIGMIIVDPAFNFCQAMAQGVRDNLREGDELLEYSYNYDTAVQADIIDDLITKQVDMIIIEALDLESLVAPLRNCQDAGIPVVLMDGKLEGDNENLVVATVENDVYNVGYLQGKSLCEAASGEGKVGYISWVNGGPAATGRIEGFRAAVEEYPNVEIVSDAETETTTDAAMESINATLQLYPDMKGFCAFFGQAGLSAVSAIGEAGMQETCKLAVSDFDVDFAEYLKEGKIYSCVYLNAPNMGKMAIEAAYEYLGGEFTETQHLVNSEQTEVTAENVDEFLPLVTED